MNTTSNAICEALRRDRRGTHRIRSFTPSAQDRCAVTLSDASLATQTVH
jgi:hypothetical protein